MLFAEVNGVFKVLRSKTELEALIKSLEIKGAREGPLYCALKKYSDGLKDTELPVWFEAEDNNGDQQKENGTTAANSVHLFANKWLTAAEQNSTPSHDWLEQLKHRLAEVETAVPPEAKSEFDQSVTSP